MPTPAGWAVARLPPTWGGRAATRLAMAAETPRAAKGKAGKSRGHRTAHAAPAGAEHTAQATGTAPKSIVPKSTAKSTAPKGAAPKSAVTHPTRVASLKKRAQ